MIRYMPDTLRDALWRPLSMAAPSGHVYVEIPAPDLRFAFVALLLVVTAWFALRGKVRTPKATRVLLLLVVLSFVPWLLTSGNGRYFIPFLLCAGPLCLALLHALPMTRGMKVALATLMLSTQAFVVFASSPIGIWSFGQWREAPYFQLSTTSELKNKPHTFIAMTAISYSLLAPQFHPASRWINIVNLPSAFEDSREQEYTRTFLKNATSLKLIIPALSTHSNAEGLPSDAAKAKLSEGLAAQKLQFASPAPCSFLRSTGMAYISKGMNPHASSAELAKSGFWVCDLMRNESQTATQSNRVVDKVANAVLEKLERACPRLFVAGQKDTNKTDGGVTRSYHTDIKIYVLKDAGVFYKYWTALNPVRIDSIEGVLSDGFTMDCNNIRGRSGLPWEREI